MPLLWLSVTFLGGIGLGAALALPAGLWLALGAGAGGGFLLLGRWMGARGPSPGLAGRRWAVALPWPVLLAVACLGAARLASARPGLAPDFIAWYNDTGVAMSVVGVVDEPPDRRDTHTNLRVRVESVRLQDSVLHTRVEGLVLARLLPDNSLSYGDRVVLEGQLETPPQDETFSYQDYLARQGVYAMMPQARAAFLESGRGNPLLAALFRLRARAQALIYRLFPDPEASLLVGILLGVETGIPEPVQRAFKDTGTSHVIAISGFNITILAGMFASGFGRWLGPRAGGLAAVAGIAAYTVLVGGDAAVVRAAVMGGLGVFARQLGRRQAALNSLAFTAALMALFNPHLPWDVGFQLSFSATLGLVLYADPLAEGFVRLASRVLPEAAARRLAGPAGEYVLFTLAAQVTTFPVTAYHFQRLSLSAFLANPLILPVQPAVMIGGGLAVILGLLAFPLGQVAAWLVWPTAAYTIRVVEWFAGLPAGVLPLGRVSLAGVVLFYALLLGATLAWDRMRPAIQPALALSGLAVVAVLAWRAVLAAPDGRLHLTVLEVGSGEALLVQTPAGRQVLIGGGPRPSLLSDALGRRLPAGARRLDWLVVAAPAESHVAGLPAVLERFPPAQVLWAGSPHGSRAARTLGEGLAEAGIEVTPAEAGHVLDLGDGAVLEVLAAGPRGAVLRLAWGRFRALLPVGLDLEALESLEYGRAIGPVSALLLAESGYTPANPPEWLASLNPQVVLLSVAAGDRLGLPSRETLAALEGYTVLRTDEQGWIEVTTDGQRMWVRVGR